MIKKTVASLGLAAAATAGAALLMGSPASAETIHGSTQTTVADVQTTDVTTARHDGDERGWSDDRYGHQGPYDWTQYDHWHGQHWGRHHHRHPQTWTWHHYRHPHHVRPQVVIVRGGDWR